MSDILNPPEPGPKPDFDTSAPEPDIADLPARQEWLKKLREHNDWVTRWRVFKLAEIRRELTKKGAEFGHVETAIIILITIELECPRLGPRSGPFGLPFDALGVFRGIL